MKPTPLRVALTVALLALQAMAPASEPDSPDALTTDGGRYYGPLLNGKLHGRGRLEWNGGARYEGEFANGLMSGSGRKEFGNGTVYEGQFRDGLPSGQGELRYSNGRTYRGQFLRGHFEGKGRLEHDGEVYEGDFKGSDFTGQGRYSRKDSGSYEGAFEKWKFHGAGRFTDPNGISYEGNFVNGSLQGSGKVTGHGTVYEGELQHGMPNGRGVMRHANGDVYEGHFQNGMYEGQGTLRYGKPRNGRTEESGIWRFGSLPGKGEDRKQIVYATETALYAQKELLDKAVGSLKAGQPGNIDLYLMTVAGDGSQEVFRREVEFVQQAFAERFATAGRSVALINSRNTLTSAPMATVTSIRVALQAIAAKMNTDEDVLFLFLTSHGSREHELTLNQVGMGLRGLPAGELGQLLRESGIRWKVVVVSACYSGGFIDALKDERTLIITAARHDRTSFGCADENDFTYFGRAFFKEALPEAQSFQQAFSRASGLVNDWERKDVGSGASHSLPQIHSTAAIEAHLQRWWAQSPR